jgi:hypothetical protein
MRARNTPPRYPPAAVQPLGADGFIRLKLF